MRPYHLYRHRYPTLVLQETLQQRFQRSKTDILLKHWLEQNYPDVVFRTEIESQLLHHGMLCSPDLCSQWFCDHRLGYNLTEVSEINGTVNEFQSSTHVMLTEFGQAFLFNYIQNSHPSHYETPANNQA